MAWAAPGQGGCYLSRPRLQESSRWRIRPSFSTYLQAEVESLAPFDFVAVGPAAARSTSSS